MDPFQIKDCALIGIATGRRASDLRELRDRIEEAHPGSIYYHFWGGLLSPGFDQPDWSNDFAAWAKHQLHDALLAERLNILSPMDYADLEALRTELVEVLADRLDEDSRPTVVHTDRPFQFVRSLVIVFDTGQLARSSEELMEAIPKLSAGSIFYHFIDARRRTEDHQDDFSKWLAASGPEQAGLVNRIRDFDPWFHSLAEIRQQLTDIVHESRP